MLGVINDFLNLLRFLLVWIFCIIIPFLLVVSLYSMYAQ